jgi:hypothetical protein
MISEEVRDEGLHIWPRDNPRPFEGETSEKYRTISNAEEILRDNLKNMSSRLMSRGIIIDFDDLLFKQTFSNDHQTPSLVEGFRRYGVFHDPLASASLSIGFRI